MTCISLEQLVAAIVEHGVAMDERPEHGESWFQVSIKSADARLSRSFLARYSSEKSELRVWTHLEHAYEASKTSTRLHLAILCLNGKLHGAVLAKEDGSLYYKSPRWILTKPDGCRRLFALAMTEARFVQEALQQMEESDEDPVAVAEGMPSHREHIDRLLPKS